MALGVRCKMQKDDQFLKCDRSIILHLKLRLAEFQMVPSCQMTCLRGGCSRQVQNAKRRSTLEMRSIDNAILTINRRHSLPGLVRSQDNCRIAERLSHAEAPTHRQQSVSLFTQLVYG